MGAMSYSLSTFYSWYLIPNQPSELIKVYAIESIPYSFDLLPEITKSDPELIKEAEQNRGITLEQMNKWSDYLIKEEAHPLLFDLKLKNPQELPTT